MNLILGRVQTSKTKTKTLLKFKKNGLLHTFFGYSDNHEGDSYYMLDPIGNCKYLTRDIVWLKRIFFTKTTLVNISVSSIIIIREANTNENVISNTNNNENVTENKKDNYVI